MFQAALLIINVLFLALLGFSVWFIMRSNARKNGDAGRDALEQFRKDVQTGLNTTAESLRNEFRDLRSGFTSQMAKQSDVLRETNTGLNERMDKAAQVIGDVKRELGKMTTVARSIDELQNILKAPKMRGGFGELFLGDLLQQILPSEHFAIQHRFRDGEVVDAVIFLGDKMVPIDSKFPLEGFQRIAGVSNDQDIPKNLRRQFINDVKKHIQGVAKYIRTDEGTYDFALMYIPAENIYYEVAVKDDVGGEGRELLNYALKSKVIPVSPNTLYAYLMTIIVGLKGMQVEKHAEKMLAKMASVQKNFTNFHATFSKLGTHLKNAQGSYDDAKERLVKVEGKLEAFEVADAAPELEEKKILEIESSQESAELQ